VSVDFNAPPGWPAPPVGWLPPPGWQPPISWPSAPAGWTFYLELVPAYRSRLTVRTDWDRADPGYVGRGAWLPRIRGFAQRNSLVLVPLALVAGVVVLIVLIAGLALGANSLESAAVQACTRLLNDQVPDTASTTTGAPRARPVVIDDVRTVSPTLMVVTGTYRGADGTVSFTCPVSTAAGSPVVGEIEWGTASP